MSPRARTNTRQTRPDRRYRRLLPAALVTATVAAGFPLAGPPPAGAAAPKRMHVAPPQQAKAVTVRPADTPRSGRAPAG